MFANRIALSVREVNPQSGQYVWGRGEYQATPVEREALDRVRAELEAGRYVRCPKCFDWFDRRKMGAIMSHTLRDPLTNEAIRFVAYALCKRCKRAHLDTGDFAALTEAVAAYFAGEYQDARGGGK